MEKQNPLFTNCQSSSDSQMCTFLVVHEESFGSGYGKRKKEKSTYCFMDLLRESLSFRYLWGKTPPLIKKLRQGTAADTDNCTSQGNPICISVIGFLNFNGGFQTGLMIQWGAVKLYTYLFKTFCLFVHTFDYSYAQGTRPRLRIMPDF